MKDKTRFYLQNWNHPGKDNSKTNGKNK